MKIEDMGLKQFPLHYLATFENKRSVAEKCIPSNITYDTALPQHWIDAFSKVSNYSYHEILFSTFVLYPDHETCFGLIWSAALEIDEQIGACNL